MTIHTRHPLVGFLATRIEEDEAKIDAMRRETNRAMTAPIRAWGSAAATAALTGISIFTDPGRWAAECAAKRRILDEHRAEWHHAYEAYACPTCDHDDLRAAWPCATVRALAAVYADHPDYREEWRP